MDFGDTRKLVGAYGCLRGRIPQPGPMAEGWAPFSSRQKPHVAGRCWIFQTGRTSNQTQPVAKDGRNRTSNWVGIYACNVAAQVPIILMYPHVSNRSQFTFLQLNVDIPKKFAGVQTSIIFTRYDRDRQRQSIFYKSYINHIALTWKNHCLSLIRSCIPIQPGLSNHLMTLNLWPLCPKVILPNIGWQVTAAETPMISARALVKTENQWIFMCWRRVGGFHFYRDINLLISSLFPQESPVSTGFRQKMPSNLDPPELPQDAWGLSNPLVHLDAQLDENRLQLVLRGEANHPNHHPKSKYLVTHLDAAGFSVTPKIWCNLLEVV